MHLETVDIYAVGLATLASVALGYLWYSDFALGRAYARATGKTPAQFARERRKTGALTEFILSVITSLVMAAVLAYLMDLGPARTASDGLLFGLYIWGGFVAIVLGSLVLHEGKHLNYFFITAGHRLVELMMMGAILGAFSGA